MSHRFFQNKDCEYFPCHETPSEGAFNCLFCYCPMYHLECPGDARKVGEIRDCSHCDYPHHAENYTNVLGVISEAILPKPRGGNRQ